MRPGWLQPALGRPAPDRRRRPWRWPDSRTTRGHGTPTGSGGPLQEDTADYFVWEGTDDDFRLRACVAGVDNGEYIDHAIVGTTYSGPDINGGWHAALVHFVPAAGEDLGYYCRYQGFVHEHPIMAMRQFVQTDRTCSTYLPSGEG